MRELELITRDEDKLIVTYLDTIRGLSDSTDDYLYLWEIKDDRMWICGNITAKYDLNCEEKQYITTEEWTGIIYKNDLPAFQKDIGSIAEGKSTVHDMEYRLIDKEGKRIWVNCRGKVKSDKNGDPLVMIGRVSDMALRYKVDELTGMFNTAKFKEDMQREFLCSGNGYFLLLGVDNLKRINIRYGYEHGDRALKLLADILEEETEFRNAYRMEKDCFGVFLPDADKAEVEKFYNKIQSRISENFEISGGAASIENAAGKDGGKLYQYAEYALDRAKIIGKNQLEFFSKEDYRKDLASIALSQELADSIRTNFTGFSLVYQPQIKTGSYRLFGAEVLLRYDSPTRGRIMPNDFIPILEQSGLICDVGLWVLKTALKQCRKWREKMPEFHISVNLSSVQLMQKDITEKVLDALNEAGIPGDALTLELTESMQLQNLRLYNEIFSEWKKVGIKIAVDDFGTGYSNLGYLKDLKIDEVKIDKCFISGIHKNSYNYRLLYSVIELVAGTQIRVCCEGVEEKEELLVLEELKPDLLQGYLFSKPCDCKQFESMYFNRKTQDYLDYRKHIELMQKKHFGKLMKLRHSDILKSIDLGLWVIRIDGNTGVQEMYADDTMLRIMGADSNLSPEECYQFWYSRVKAECVDYVNETVVRCISGEGTIQIQYIWEHPDLGDVEVCCAATCTENDGSIIQLEGYHRIVSNIEISYFEG